MDYSVIVILKNLEQCDQPNTQIEDTFVVSPSITLSQLGYFSTYEVSISARAADSSYATAEPTTMDFETKEAGKIIFSYYQVYNSKLKCYCK